MALLHKRPWWQNWEVYVILALAAFLRLIFINTTQFMIDHAMFYQMANDAWAHHWIPISGNRASAGPFIPPLFVYFMMLPALISSNPVSGAIFIALCSIASVLLTYLFTLRYYGRFAATAAGLLYATAVNILIFSRDIWQPDLLPPLVVLFMWLLFRGAVDQRRNWFFPAVLLLGAMYQLHSTAIYLAIPLVAAVVLSFRTIRWRDLILAAVGLLLLFLPYIYLEYVDRLTDIKQLIQLARQPAMLSKASVRLYSLFVQSDVQKLQVNPVQIVDTHIFPANAQSILSAPIHFLLHIESSIAPFLLIIAVLLCLFLLFRPDKAVSYKDGLIALWRDFQSSGFRKGLFLLLVWQGLVLLMMRTAVSMFIHYLLFLIPGPFILLALFFSVLAGRWDVLKPSWQNIGRYASAVLLCLVVLAQCIGSFGTLVDRAEGHFDGYSVYPAYYDLASQQNILATADQLAQEHHIGRIYLAINAATEFSLQYLAQFEKTPIVTFKDDNCVVLPSSSVGPVIFVTSSDDARVEPILSRYASSTLVKTVVPAGGHPYFFYVLNADAEPAPAIQLAGGWQALSDQTRVITNAPTNDEWLVTRWRVPVTQLPASRSTYNFHLSTSLSVMQNCFATATYVGDQIFILQDADKSVPLPATMRMQVFTARAQPELYHLAGLSFTTYDRVESPSTAYPPLTGGPDIVMKIVSQ